MGPVDDLKSGVKGLFDASPVGQVTRGMDALGGAVKSGLGRVAALGGRVARGGGVTGAVSGLFGGGRTSGSGGGPLSRIGAAVLPNETFRKQPQALPGRKPVGRKAVGSRNMGGRR